MVVEAEVVHIVFKALTPERVRGWLERVFAGKSRFLLLLSDNVTY